ncbi:TPA: DNA topoisomerase III, partial [Escherichia coli]|nr:DNA topoisomerase III [Escherichia coli]
PVLAQLDPGFVSRIWNDKKITAHHAIIPTRQVFDIRALSEDELKVYLLVRQHYLAQFLPLQESDITDATLTLGGQRFRARGKVNVVTGWRGLFSGEAAEATEGEDEQTTEMALPALERGEHCRISGSELKDRMTSPPAPFTEGTLIAAMKNAASQVSDPKLKKVLRENAGLGTEATRAGVLEVLFARQYLEKSGKHIRSTQRGRELTAALPEALTSPGMTALWEQALDDIAQGRMSLDTFMGRQQQWVRHLVSSGREQPFSMTVPVTPPCPLCQGPTRQRKGKHGLFLSCQRYPECKGVVNTQKKVGRRKKSGKTKTE